MKNNCENCQRCTKVFNCEIFLTAKKIDDTLTKKTFHCSLIIPATEESKYFEKLEKHLYRKSGPTPIIKHNSRFLELCNTGMGIGVRTEEGTGFQVSGLTLKGLLHRLELNILDFNKGN